MYRSIIALLLIAVSCTSATAWRYGDPVVGGAVLNIGGPDRIPANFINILKVANIEVNAAADGGLFDDDGYLIGSPSANVSLTFPPANTMWNSVNNPPGTYRLLVGSGIQFSGWVFNFAITSCSTTGQVAVTNCTGSGANTVSTTGSGGGTLTFTTAVTQISTYFPASGTYSRSGGNMALYRVSDEAAYQAGEIFTPEYLATVIGAKPRVVRPMGWVQAGAGNFNGESLWRYRNTLTSITWGNRYPSGAWAGTISGTDQYTASAPTDVSSFADGTVVMGNVSNAATQRFVITNAVSNGGNVQFTVASTTGLSPAAQVYVGNVQGTTEANGVQTILTVDSATTFTINVPFVHAYIAPGVGQNVSVACTQTLTVTGIGTTFLADRNGKVSCTSTGNNVAVGVGTFVYDIVLGVFKYYSGNYTSSVPIEAQVQLANRVRASLWATIPPWATNDYALNWATIACASLTSNLFFIPEYSNEIWNFAFPQSLWATEVGTALGFSSSVHSWYGLRVRQIMGGVIPTACPNGKYYRIMAYQAAGDSTTVTYRFNGTNLVPGNANYNSYTGSANYSAFPNRPIDVVENIANAPYASGSNLCQGPDFGCTPTSANAPFFQALITAYEASDNSTVVSLIDEDMRNGVASKQSVTASGTTFTTTGAHGFTTSSLVGFQVTGGTIYSGIVANTLYKVSSTSSAGCPGAVTCNFTIQGYVGGFNSGANINAGSAGTGAVTVGLNSTGSAHNFMTLGSTWWQFAEANAALYDSIRTSNSMPLLRVTQYEGNLEPQGLSAAQCVTLGIITSPPDGTGALCASEIAAAIVIWKNDPAARATQTAYFNQFMGYDITNPATYNNGAGLPHSRLPAQLLLGQSGSSCTGSAYPLLSGCLPTSTPFQTYYGFGDFRPRVN